MKQKPELLGATDHLKKALGDYGGISVAMMQVMGVNSAVEEATKNLKDLVGIGKINKQFASVNVSLADTIQKAGLGDLQDRMRGLSAVTGEGSALSKLANSVSEQHRAIEAMSRSPLDKIDISTTLRSLDIKNPIIETNERLERIERRFEQFQEIAKDSATIATGLQGAAAEFLQKFEATADKNDKSADKAIKIGEDGVKAAKWAVRIAIFIPVLLLGAQFYANHRVPDPSTAALQASVVELRTELGTLRESQAGVSDRLIEALATADNETAAALRMISEQLMATRESNTLEP